MSDKQLSASVLLRMPSGDKILPNCVVKFFATKPAFYRPYLQNIKEVSTDAQGEFSVDLNGPEFKDLQKVYLTFSHPEGLSRNTSTEIDLTTHNFGRPVSIYLEEKGAFSNFAGWMVFSGAVLILAAIVVLYVCLHNNSAAQNDISKLDTIISYTMANVNHEDSLKKSDLITSLQSALVSEVDTLDKSGEIDSVKAGTLRMILGNSQSYIDVNNNALYRNTIDQLVREFDFKEPSYLWTTKPCIYLEILFWTLIASLLRLIVNTGWYLNTGRFIKSTIPHKLGVLIMIPFVSIIISVILSYIDFTFTIGGTGFKFDFSDVETAVIIAFFIGMTPWESWDFLKDLAGRFASALGAVGSNES